MQIENVTLTFTNVYISIYSVQSRYTFCIIDHYSQLKNEICNEVAISDTSVKIRFILKQIPFRYFINKYQILVYRLLRPWEKASGI